MNSEIQISYREQQQLAPAPMTMYGDHGTQIGEVKNYDASKHLMVIASRAQGKHDASEIDTSIVFDYNCYHLFVMDSDDFEGPSFVLKKEVSLTESTPEDLKQICGTFSQDAIDRIKTYPAVFASLNHQCKETDSEHMAYYGYVIGVDILHEVMRISFVALQSFPQQVLNDNLTAFGLESSWGTNELDNIHWAIKKVNLIETLKDLGLKVLSY